MPHRQHPAFLRAFFRDRDGAFVILFAFILVLLVLAVGFAVDYGRMLVARTSLANAVDAATLATARALSINEISENRQKKKSLDYFKRVFAANVGDDTFDANTYSIEDFSVDTEERTVAASVSTFQPLYLLPVGIDRDIQKLAAHTAVAYGSGPLEVALVLDVTGSMALRGKIDALKIAAKSAVEILLGDGGSPNEEVRVSVVPYNTAVNAGPFARFVFADYRDPQTDAPVYDPDFAPAEYDVDDFQQPYRVCQGGGRQRQCALPPDFRVNPDGTNVDDCATDRKAPASRGARSYQYTTANPSKGMISRDSRLAERNCSFTPIMPLTDDRDTLLQVIDALQAYGSTSGHVGLQWGRYTLAHDWADYMPSPASAPGDLRENKELKKYIVFMTDGNNNAAFADNGKKSAHDQPAADRHMSAHCEAAKTDDGVKLFAIGFGTTNHADRILKQCASPDTEQIVYFHTADDNRELLAAFEYIGKSIKQIRITH